MTRVFDILFSLAGIIVLFPVFLIIYILIILESRGGGFYFQNRVGKDGINFKLIKFRSMSKGSDKNGLITIGSDSRISQVGHFIRRYKIDELPQLFNVLIGDMSIVGPRPEVRKYVNLYNAEQRQVLKVRPGISDYASIEFVSENEILGNAINPEEVYIDQVMPQKLVLNMKYIERQTVKEYFKIIFLTLKRIIIK